MIAPAKFTMETTMKRLVTAALAAALIAFAGSSLNVSAAPAGYYQDQKVVYHNDGGGPDNSAYFKRMLNSIKNHIAAAGKDHVEIRVVDHGAGVDLFQAAKTDKELGGRLDALRADGVRFLVCANTLKERQIDWHQLYGVKEDDIVPSGVAELARLQAMGFVYIHL
jgi:intracellular sulfur oxidation DsrE/DsrF family protein